MEKAQDRRVSVGIGRRVKLVSTQEVQQVFADRAQVLSKMVA